MPLGVVAWVAEKIKPTEHVEDQVSLGNELVPVPFGQVAEAQPGTPAQFGGIRRQRTTACAEQLDQCA